MGVDGLGVFLRTKVPQAFSRRPLADFYGSSMAFDTTLTLYEAFHRNAGREAAALRDMQRWAASIKALDVTATFVFDGSTAGLKPRAHRQRAEARARSLAAADAPGVSEGEAAKLRARAAIPSSEFIANVQAAVGAAGSVTVAADDAERLVAHLVSTGAVQHGVSKDYDALVYGAPRLVLRFPEEHPEEVDLGKVLAGLKLTSLHAFVDVAILAGCDFTPKIPTVGIVKALKAIQGFGSIGAALAMHALPRPPPDFDYGFARRRFRAADSPSRSEGGGDAAASNTPTTVMSPEAEPSVGGSVGDGATADGTRVTPPADPHLGEA